MSSHLNIWAHRIESKPIKKEEPWQWRAFMSSFSYSQCHSPTAISNKRIEEEGPLIPSKPMALFKTRMCPRWLSGCYLGDNRCHCAHRVDDLFKPFYTKEMISHYQKIIKIDIDSHYLARLCKVICDTYCDDPLLHCLFRGNTSMGNKWIKLCMPTHSTMLPYCTVTCNCCKTVKRVEIYTFILLSS